MGAEIVVAEHIRKVFSYINPDPNSNDTDMWFAYIMGLLGRRAGSFSAQRKTVVALDDVSIAIRPGEFFTILGPNGVGKTTLVKVLATILKPTAGHAVVNGFDIRRDPSRVRASIAVVPASGWLAFDGELTVGENLMYWARLYGLGRHTATERVKAALTTVGLAEWYNQRPSFLSSGMRQRLAIAKGLLFRAPVFILDEPTANIDPAGAYQIRDFIRNDLNRRLGQTVILTTHNMAEAEQLSDRVAIIDRGRVIACDTPGNLVSGLGDSVIEFKVVQWSRQASRTLREQKVALRILEFLDEQNSGRVRIQLRDGADAGAILASLRSYDVQIGDVSPAAMNLEDVFIRYAGRGLDDSSSAD